MSEHQDTYAYEEEQERKELMQRMHQPMKKWYNLPNNSAIKDKYGLFPYFWQDMGKWEPFLEVKKLYLVSTEREESQGEKISGEDLLKEFQEKAEKAKEDGGSAAASVEAPTVEEEEPEKEEGATDWSKLRVKALREALQLRGLSSAGKKADLIKRLQFADKKGIQPKKPEPEPEPEQQSAPAPVTSTNQEVEEASIPQEPVQTETSEPAQSLGTSEVAQPDPATETSEGPKPESSDDPPEAPKAEDGAQPAAMEVDGENKEGKSAEDGAAAAEAGKRKRERKSRWGAKKKKSRWGDANPSSTALAAALIPPKGESTPAEENTENKEDTETAPGEEGAEGKSKKRRSRWGPDDTAKKETSSLFPDLNANLSQEQVQEMMVMQMKLKQVNEKLATVVEDAKAHALLPPGERSPSPDPIYDQHGNRVNTREVVMRRRLNDERQSIIEGMIKLNPQFKPPADFRTSKPTAKLYIPTKQYPGYNFIGCIIGPRGNTQKRLQQETGCKIQIRGKGAVKEGSKGRQMGSFEDQNDELHVFIMGDTKEQVESAKKVVEKLLVPLEEDNEHKAQQLRELALINGTLKDDEYCHICGDKGHRQFECPKRQTTRKLVDIKCAICGDNSHPTRDCTQKKDGVAPSKQHLDNEYLSFMAELKGEKPPPPVPATSTSQPETTQSTPSTSKSTIPTVMWRGPPKPIGGALEPPRGYMGARPRGPIPWAAGSGQTHRGGLGYQGPPPPRPGVAPPPTPPRAPIQTMKYTPPSAAHHHKPGLMPAPPRPPMPHAPCPPAPRYMPAPAAQQQQTAPRPPHAQQPQYSQYQRPPWGVPPAPSSQHQHQAAPRPGTASTPQQPPARPPQQIAQVPPPRPHHIQQPPRPPLPNTSAPAQGRTPTQSFPRPPWVNPRGVPLPPRPSAVNPPWQKKQ